MTHKRTQQAKQRLQDAKDPNTAPELLAELATYIKYREWVAQNPNTPGEVLFNLLGVYPAQVLAHPNFALFLQREPEALAKILPGNLLMYLAFPSVPLYFLESIAASTNPELLQAIFYRREFNEALAQRFAIHESPKARRLVASSFLISGALLEALTRDPDFEVRVSAARNSNLSPDLYERLSIDENFYVIAALIHNPNIPRELLLKLSTHNDVQVRQAVAYRTGSPQHLLESLATDESPVVRRNVAGNQATPASVLARLAADPDVSVRRRLAENKSAPISILEMLLEDPDEEVRYLLLCREDRPSSLPEKFYYDPSAKIRQRIVQKAHTLPIDILKHFSQDEDSTVRMLIAYHPQTPTELLAVLAQDKEFSVRDATRLNYNSPKTY
jgi:hypothetical protein